jgi:hypothetical protein
MICFCAVGRTRAFATAGSAAPVIARWAVRSQAQRAASAAIRPISVQSVQRHLSTVVKGGDAESEAVFLGDRVPFEQLGEGIWKLVL